MQKTGHSVLDMLFQDTVDLREAVGTMRAKAVDARLDSVLHDIVSSALFTQEIERTVAEKTVEILFRNALVAGEIPALSVTEESFRIVHALRALFLQALNRLKRIHA